MFFELILYVVNFQIMYIFKFGKIIYFGFGKEKKYLYNSLILISMINIGVIKLFYV